jgi:hypothetical protein
MADTLGTAQSDWTDEGTTTNAATTALDTWTFFDGTLLPSPPNPYQITLPVSNTIALMFFGDPDGSGDEVIEVQFWAVNPIPAVSGYKIGVWLGQVEADLGTTSSADLSASTQFFCDIRVVDDRSLNPPGMRVISADPDSGKGAAILMFDTLGAKQLFIQIKCGTGIAKAGLAWRAF